MKRNSLYCSVNAEDVRERGGGDPRVWNDWCSSFQQITFNLGNFTNLKELFQVEERLVT